MGSMTIRFLRTKLLKEIGEKSNENYVWVIGLLLGFVSEIHFSINPGSQLAI